MFRDNECKEMACNTTKNEKETIRVKVDMNTGPPCVHFMQEIELFSVLNSHFHECYFQSKNITKVEIA